MSSTIKMSVPRTSKTVLNERNKSAIGTAKNVVKRKMICEEKTKQRGLAKNVTNTLLTKHVTGQSRPKLQGLSKENGRLGALNEKRGQLKAVAAGKEKTATSILNRTDTDFDETPGLVSLHDQVKGENGIAGGESNKLIIEKVGELPSTANKTCKIESSKVTKSISKSSALSETCDVSVPDIIENYLYEIPVQQDISLNAGSSVETVASLCKTDSDETKSKLSLPKANSVISNSCVPDQAGLLLPDVKEDTFYSTDTPRQTLSVFSKDSDTNKNKITQNVKEYVIPSSTKSMKQMIPSSSRSQTLQNEKKGTKIAKSSVPKSIPNYQRTTSSSANKDIKKKPIESQSGNSNLRPVSEENRSQLSDYHNNKSTLQLANKNKSKPDTVLKDWQSGLRSCDIPTKESQRHTSKSIENNSSLQTRSSPDEKNVAIERSSNGSETPIVASANKIKTQNFDTRSRSRSPSEPIPRTTIQRTSTPNELKNKLNNGEAVNSRPLIPRSPISGSKEDNNSAVSSNLKKQKKEISKTTNVRGSNSQIKSQILCGSSRSSFPKPSKLSLRPENSKKACGSTSRTSKLFSLSLKRKDTPPEVDIDTLSRTPTRVVSFTSDDRDHYSTTDSEQLTVDLKLQNLQQERKITTDARSRSSTPESLYVTLYGNDCSKLERHNSRKGLDPKRPLETMASSMSSNGKCELKSIPRQTVTSLNKKNTKNVRTVKSDSNLRLQSPRSCSTSASISNNSSKPPLKIATKGQKPASSQKVKKMNNESTSRSRSTTPDVSFISSSCASSISCISKATLSICKQNNAKIEDSTIRRETDSKSRTTTPSADSTFIRSDTNNTLIQQKIQTEQKYISRESNSRSRSTTPGASSSSSGSDSSTKCTSKKNLSSLKQVNPKTGQKITRVSKLRSQSTTAGAFPTRSCSDPCAERTSKQNALNVELEFQQKGQKVNKDSTPQGSFSVSSERNNKSNKSLSRSTISTKRQNAQTQEKTYDSNMRSGPTSSHGTAVVSSDLKMKSTTKQTTLKQEFYQGDRKNNRDTKSRSRSSTPGSASTTISSDGNKCQSTTLKQTSQECKMTGVKNAKELSVLTGKNIDNKSSSSANTMQSGQEKKGLKSSKLSGFKTMCVSSNKNSTSTIPKQTPVLKTKTIYDNGRNLQKHASSKTTLGDVSHTQPGLQAVSSEIPIPVQVKLKSMQGSPLNKPSKSKNTVPSSVTQLKFQQGYSKSCNTLTAADNTDSTKAKSNNQHLSESKNICSNKTQMLSTGTSDKAILKSTKLSIKPESWINAGKISISEGNKNSGSIKTSSENKSCVQTGSTNIQKKVNKTFVSDNKSGKTASLSVINRDNVSTKSCNKSDKNETRKQKTQLPESFKFCIVNIEHETECMYTNDELHYVSLNSDLIKSTNELVSSSESDGKSSVKSVENMEIVQHHITTDKKGSSNTVNLDNINTQENRTQFGNSSSSGFLIDSICTDENLCLESNEHKSLGESTLFSNAESTNINFTDREVTVRDPKAKVNCNCLSDFRENEEQHVTEGILREISSAQNENANCYCSHRQPFINSSNKMDLSQTEGDSDISELLCVKKCDECKRQSEISLQQLDSQAIILCNARKDESVSHSISDYYKNAKHSSVENKCQYCNEDVPVDNKKYKSLEQNGNLQEPETNFSRNFKSQSDNGTETQTFGIDTFDVNSSHKVPITEGCALKHTEFTDSQGDKAKCTDAVPVTGAVSLQITNKRQDKKILSLSSCGIRNTALLSNRNGFIHIFDGHDGHDARANDRSASYDQNTGNIDTRQNRSIANSNGSAKKWQFKTCQANTALNDSRYCKGSSAIEQSLSDWQNEVLYDRICSENIAELQVLNNCEINKETSEPEHDCRKLNSSDIFSCMNMDTLQEVNHTQSSTDIVSHQHIKCDTICNLNSKSSNEKYHEITPQKRNTVQELECAVSLQNLSAMKLKYRNENSCEEIDDIVCNNWDQTLCAEGDRKSCVPKKSYTVYHGSKSLIENRQTNLRNVLTSDSQNDESICNHVEETSLPERNLRTIDAKLINTEHDLSFHACENVSKKTSESDHTGIDVMNHSKICKCKQYQCDNDKSIEIVSNYEKNDISGTLPKESFLQNQLLRFKPDGVLSESKHQGDATATPYVLEVQEKQTNCLDYANDSASLFSQQAISEDGVVMTQYDCVNEFREFNEHATEDRKSHCSQNEGNHLLDKEYFSSVSEINIKNSGLHEDDMCSVFQKQDNRFISTVPRLSECVYKMYPNLKSEKAASNKISIEEEINHENLQCSNMTQTANMNNCTFNMKLNDSACLFQHYKQAERDDINVSLECKYCAGLSQTSKDISNDNSKSLHSQYDSNEVNSAEQGSLGNEENNLCTGSMPCDGNKLEISTLINRNISSEYHELNDLSQFFDDCGDSDSCGIMSCDHAHAASEVTELSSVSSAELTDCKTLEKDYPTSYQDCFEDKSSDLSTVKITTQKSSCNLIFSEKSSEPKDFVLRYESKNSASHKKFYSCKDEPDTGITGTQEENNFRNLADNRDEDINLEIKLNNSNIETPTHCGASSQESENINTKITLGNQGQDIETVQEFSSAGATKLFEQGVLCEYSNFDQNGGHELLVHLDNIEKDATLSADETFLNGDNRFPSINPEHRSDKDNQDYHNVVNGLLQEYSIKTDRSQTEEDLNSKLPLHREEATSTLDLTKTLNYNASGVLITEIKNEKRNSISDNLHREANVACFSEQQCDLDSQYLKKQNDVTDIKLNSADNGILIVLDCDNSSVESNNDKKKDFNLPDILENTGVLVDKESGTRNRESISSPLDETLSDTSEAFTDAEERVNSPYSDKFKSEDCATTGKNSNISCRESTSTESFVDAVENLDDDYLTSVNFRHSKEFENEENLPQVSSDSDDSTTSVIGYMEDLSGWEEFSENITDLNDYSGEMEARRYDVTKTERNTFYNIPDGQTHTSVCRTHHVFEDKNYQSPSPSLESNEIYPSVIKTNTLRYKDMRYDAEQNIIGDSIFETGNGGSLSDINDKSVRVEAGIGSNTRLQDDSYTGKNHQGVTVSHDDNIKKSTSSITTLNAENELLETTESKSVVGSKIETAVIKRTQRRRRRQIEQQKCNISHYSEKCTEEEDRTIAEIHNSNLHHPSKTCDNDSIEKNLSPHSEHFMYSCTVSDNMTFNNELASGTQVLSEQVNTNLNLNEFNLELSTNTGTPLNYDYEDCVTKEVSMGADKVDTTDCTFAYMKNESILKDREKQLNENETCAYKNGILEIVTSGDNDFEQDIDRGKSDTDTCVDISVCSVQKDITKTKAENSSELIIEHVQKTDTDFDDIQFIDADDASNNDVENENIKSKDNSKLKDSESKLNEDKAISPNISFTFSFGEECKHETSKLNQEALDDHFLEQACCIELEKVDDTENTHELVRVHPRHAVEKDTVEEYVSTLKEEDVTCEINNTNRKYVASLENERNQVEVCDNSENIKYSLSLNVIDSNDIMVDNLEDSEEGIMQTDICEESNISVRHALEIEKQKLANGDDIRSRKSLFISKRNDRRATIDNCSFEEKEDRDATNESRNENETTAKNPVKKSQSFRLERKQISPMASFMNPPEITDKNGNNEPTDVANKKVSDICKSFMTKTRASVQRTRSQSSSKSPAPQRKLMKWVNNQGKWMRVPVDEQSDNIINTNKVQNDYLQPSAIDNKSILGTSDSAGKVNPKPNQDKTSKNQDNFKQMLPSSDEDIQPSVDNSETRIATTDKTEISNKGSSKKMNNITGLKELSCLSSNKIKAEVENETSESKLSKASTSYDDKNGLICFQKKNTSKYAAGKIVSEKSLFKPSPETIDIHAKEDVSYAALHDNSSSNVIEKEFSHKESVSSAMTIFDDGFDKKDQDKGGTIISIEPDTNESERALEVKVIGTTLNDAQCDQEKHIKRQELLFGLLDSYNRRKPRRFTQHESMMNIQNTCKSASDNADKVTVRNVNIDSNTKKVMSSDKPENMLEKPKCIPKIKAIKIQEEVFECKREYLKETNISSSSNIDDGNPIATNTVSKTIIEGRNSENLLKQQIRKSKTFSGLGDFERQKRFTHTDSNVSTINLGDAFSGSHEGMSSMSRMVDKRVKAGLKLNLEKANTGATYTFQSDRSPSRLETVKSRGRSQDDRSPNGLCVEQPRMRVRSPEKGQRQIQRSKLLSEIVEVEENKDDISVTCDERQQQRQYSDRQRQEVQTPVKRSSKRRSLSLPTGTLAFGEARIVYKNGHFTIETMDTSEYESVHPSDYHSSSSHLDSQEDDLWDMPDTSGVKTLSSERTDMHDKPLMRRQNAKTVLKSSDSTEDVFYNETDFTENGGLYRSNLNGESQVLNMGRTNEEVFNESCSSRTSDMSFDSYSSERMDISTDDSATEAKKLSSSSLPEGKDEEVKIVMQRAKRTSSFRAAQEVGALRLSGIEEDKVHHSTRARSVSLDERQKADLNKSPKIQSVQNQNPTFLKKVMSKRKSANENISGFTKQSESARDFFTKKMTLKGLFRKNKSDSLVNSPIKTEHPISPPIATFQDDDIGSVDTPPSSPYRTRDLRRRHTSADILKAYPDSSETDSNCPTPTQERSSISRSSISTPSTPSHEGNLFMNLSSSSAPPFRDDDEISITSASSFASSIHSPPFEQPHKPKTPKPVGASPRRNPSFSSQLSRSGSQSSQRNVLNSMTSLESEQSESFQDDIARCECSYELRHRKHKTSNRNVKGSADSLSMCQFCKQREFYRNDSNFSSSSFHKQQLTSREKLSEDSAKLRRDSSGRSNYDRLGIISQTDVASSNSNDSGIQRDASVHSSNESIKGTPDSRVRLRRNKSLSPHPDRPKSEISVKWADGDSGDYDISESPIKLRHKILRDRPRPKSDLDGSSFLSGRMKAFGSEVNLQPYCSLRNLYEMRRHDMDRQKNRRMSTPHPIKSRLQRAPRKLQTQASLVRSSSMPESLEKIHKRRKMHHLLDFHLDSLSRHMDIDDCSDESDLSFDQASLQERSLSVQSSTSQLTAMDEDEDNLTYAEALWDHITMDPEELGFRAQDVIEVLDMADKDWWFGVIEDREGWFPATFVRIRVNQDQLDDDLDLDATIQDNLTTSPKLRRISMFNKNQARSNVVNEIINAEREYVKHLKDVVEGYIQHAQKRIEMFPEERILLIFGNIETIYSFAKKFLSQLELCIDVCPHLSEIGQCFLDNERGFEIYSDYCNNHPSACEELEELCKDSKYKHFFEACRLLQELVEIPLEGFLLTPVQKICKYPLQLAELLKYTPPDHPDYMMVKDALAAMRKIATLINERKRKMESIEKIAVWQQSVVDWEGPDLLGRSSELIFSGELNKINTAGWSQERFFFLFDHQLVYCKKELLKRHVFSYKGRIDLDHCDIVDIPDGKDSQYNVTVKYAWKFHETHKDKWYLVYAKSEAVKQHWLKAIKSERQRVLEDQENDFCVPDHWKQTVLNKVRSQSHIKDKHSGGRTSHGQLMLHKDLKDFTYATLPRHRNSQKHDKKKGWFKFGGGKKSKR